MMLAVTTFIPMLNSRIIEPALGLDFFGALFVPYIVVFGLVYITNLLTSIIRSKRKCKKSWGIKSALRKGIMIGIFGMMSYFFLDTAFPVLRIIEFIFAFIPYIDVISKGMFLSFGVYFGYLFSILFWGYC